MNLRAAADRAGLPVLIYVLALLPRVIDIGRRPFWLDEVFTLQRATLAPVALVKDSFANHHMPSYFLMLSPFIGLGNPQFWLRLPSAAFGALAVVMVYLIGAAIAGRRAGCIAALILGLSPTALAFSQEARSYTMEMCLILLALYGLTKLALDLPAAGRRWRDPAAARGAWAWFIIGSAAALDVLGDGLPWLITANIVAAILVWRAPAWRRLAINFLVADLIVAVCCAPFYVIMALKQQNGFVDSVMWIPSLSAGRLWYDIGSVYLMRVADSVTFHILNGPNPAAVSWIIDTALLAAAGTAMWRLRRRPAILATLGISFAFLPLLFIVISLWRPILLPRYILWSAAPFAVLVGVGASVLVGWLPRRGQFAAAAAFVLLLFANMLPYYGQETKPRWDIAARLLASDVAPGDVVLLDDLGALPVLKVYLPAGAQAVVLADSDGNVAHARQAISQGKRVWAVYGHAGQSAEPAAWARFYKNLAPLGTPEQIQLAGNRIFITLFEPPPAPPRTVADACGTPPTVAKPPVTLSSSNICG